MKEEILVITIRQDFKIVFKHEITFYEYNIIGITEVPPGIVMGEYRHMQIEVERKEVAGP